MTTRFFLLEIAEPDDSPLKLKGDPPVRADVAEISYAVGQGIADQMEPELWMMRSARSIPLAAATALEELLR